MATINDLWVLQKHYDALSEIEKNLKKPSTLAEIKKLGIVLRDIEVKLEKIEREIDANEKKLKKNNILFTELEYQLKEIEKNLYEENISDIKQLTHLDKERENIKNDIEELETELLGNMELIEELKKEYDYLNNNFIEYKKEYTRLVKEHRTLMDEYEKKIHMERIEIEKLMSNIDGELINRFEKLIKTKKVAVVEVIDNRCSGCNMVLPSIILGRLRKNDEILLCENCHRILYLP